MLFCRAGARLGDDALSLLDGNELIGGDVREPLLGAAGPFDFEGGHLAIGAEAEGQRQIALGAETGPPAHHVPLLAGSAFASDARAYGPALGLCSDGAGVRPL